MSKENELDIIVPKSDILSKTKAIETAIVAASKAGNSVQRDYQVIALSLIQHVGKHGDIRLVRTMLDTFPESLRKDAMEKYLLEFGAMRKDDANVFHYDGEKATRLGDALSTAWWKTIKQQGYTPFVFEVELQKLIDRCSNRLTKGVSKEKGDNLSYAQVDALKAILKPKVVPITRPRTARNKSKAKAA